ncbi:ribosomal-L2-C domain-containing protein [Favolaschia claudopus]|uniref:Large ribosomal subunit protein uL2m n=1 Tax=Favolaschia claudopus TaxID=2862362 RepID=A0AAW0EFZ5_9AGAR
MAQNGCGRICVEMHGSEVVFSELSSTYPLKLLSPRTRSVGVVYLITYGGGLVSGDSVSLAVQVGSKAKLVLLSQGSTKVFKFRPGQRAASIGALQVTTQRMDFDVAGGGALFLLPDPVTCFEKASYNQIQTFRLASDASLVMLDWVTSGRKSRGEEWVFSRYYSVNEIVVDGRRVAKDRLAPYGCYAMLLLYGPQVQTVIEQLREEYGAIQVFKTAEPAELLWSFSELGDGGAVLDEAMSRTKAVFKTYKPVSPGIRHLKRPLNPHIWQGRPVLQLTLPKRKSGGRNARGRITVRHRGGGHKQRIRTVDFRREEPGIHDVVRIEYDPGRSAHIALLKNRDPNAQGAKLWSYIVAPEGIRAGDEVQSFRQGIPEGFVPGLDIARLNGTVGDDSEFEETSQEDLLQQQLEQSSSQSLALGLLRTLTLKPGNVLRLKLIPIGTVIHNVALSPTGPAILVRSAGSAAQVVGYDSRYTHVRLQSGEVRKVLQDCCATIGRVSNPLWKGRNLGKAGRARWLGRRPSVRGVAMNANDHPHGGGRGRSKSDKHPVSIWGWGTKGTRTRKPGPKGPKNSNKMVIRERPRGKAVRSN